MLFFCCVCGGGERRDDREENCTCFKDFALWSLLHFSTSYSPRDQFENFTISYWIACGFGFEEETMGALASCVDHQDICPLIR